uniref:Uncharacterized protein n=1 Tax=Rhipicephalus microplus TaxID=6941 RepID=A0A6G5AHH3_RHIMP
MEIYKKKINFSISRYIEAQCSTMSQVHEHSNIGCILIVTWLFIIPVTPLVYYSSLCQRICASIQPTAASWTCAMTGLSALVISKHAKSLKQLGSQCNEVLLLCRAQCSLVTTPQVKFSTVLILQDKMCLISVKFFAGKDGHS